MTECQGCGAWNERHRTLCVLCGTPLAETDEWDAAAELPPLPPLPDGGLSVSMPDWLRAAPAEPEPLVLSSAATDEPAVELVAEVDIAISEEIADSEAVADLLEPEPEVAAPAEQPLGPQADPRTFLRDDDFPRWIRDLPALPPRRVPQVTVTAPPAAPPESQAPPSSPHSEPEPLASAATAQDTPIEAEATKPVSVPPPPVAPAAATSSTGRQREPWETPLLVVLILGVIIAVVWALLANGLIGNVL